MLFSTWVAVQLEPLPTMTGTRPFTTLMVWATTAASSSWDMVEYSPVVPRVKIPSVPAAICRSSSWVRTSKFTLPSSWNGRDHGHDGPLQMFEFHCSALHTFRFPGQ